jgi:DNA-directed RNA polymerase subunit RPC12/RpoP
MVAVHSRYLSAENLPHQNPCAQCGKPIAVPEWFENGPHRTSYLWRCHACGYRFEAVAFLIPARTPLRPDGTGTRPRR